MEIILGIGGAVLCITFFWAWKATTHAMEVVVENERLKRRVQDLQLAGAMAMDVLKALEKAKPAPAQFDQQTTSLIKLAVVNSNENEARTAAVQVCKRLYKQIK